MKKPAAIRFTEANKLLVVPILNPVSIQELRTACIDILVSLWGSKEQLRFGVSREDYQYVVWREALDDEKPRIKNQKDGMEKDGIICQDPKELAKRYFVVLFDPKNNAVRIHNVASRKLRTAISKFMAKIKK